MSTTDHVSEYRLYDIKVDLLFVAVAAVSFSLFGAAFVAGNLFEMALSLRRRPADKAISGSQFQSRRTPRKCCHGSLIYECNILEAVPQETFVTQVMITSDQLNAFPTTGHTSPEPITPASSLGKW